MQYIMKKSIYERFLNFKTRHNLSNEVIAQIATEYADSNLELARSYFSDKYNISEYVFYKARDYAIIFCLVDKKTYERIKQKSSTNYRNNNTKNNSAADSVAHFDELLVKQQEFLDGFSKNEILDIASKYVEGISKKNIAIAYGTGEYAIQLLLKKGIIEFIFDSNLVKQISVIVGPSLSKILQQREATKNALLNCLQNQITFLKSLIRCYDLYFRNSKTKPSLESLNEQLKNAIKMYNEALRL